MLLLPRRVPLPATLVWILTRAAAYPRVLPRSLGVLKLHRYGSTSCPVSCTAVQCVVPALLNANLGLLRFLMRRAAHHGVFTGAHMAALSDGTPEGTLPNATKLNELQDKSIRAKMPQGGPAVYPVHFASLNPDTAPLRAMLLRDPSAATAADKNGPQPVHYAACAASTEPLRLLLTEWGADRRAVAGAEKRTPLICACALFLVPVPRP